MQDGSTLRETLEFQQRMYGKRDHRLDEQKIPRLLQDCWSMFWDLSSTRTRNQFGMPDPISYVEMNAYAKLLDFTFDFWEVSAIRRMDAAFINEVATRMSRT